MTLLDRIVHLGNGAAGLADRRWVRRLRSSRYSKFILEKLNQYTIQKRLQLFSLLAFLLSLGVLLIGFFFFFIIDSSNAFKGRVAEIVQQLQEMQIAEKAYLRYYDPALMENVENGSRRLNATLFGSFFNATSVVYLPQIISLRNNIKKYEALFTGVTELHGRYDLEAKKMNAAVDQVMASIDTIVEALQLKQADLQMVGGLLTVDDNEMLNVARDSKIFTLTLKTLQQEYKATGQESFQQNFEALAGSQELSIVAGLKELSNTLRRKDFFAAADNVGISLDLYRHSAQVTFKLSQQEKQSLLELDALGVTVKKIADRILRRASLTVLASKAAAVIFMAVFIGAGILGFLLLTLSFIESITEPIKNLTQAMEKIGEGDLRFAMAAQGHDELSQILQELDKTRLKLTRLMTTIIASSSMIAQSSDDLKDISFSMAASSQEMSAQSNSVSTHSEKITDNVNNISDSADHMSSSVSSVSRAIAEINRSLVEIAQNCQQEAKIALSANEQTRISTETIQKLGEAAHDIGAFITVINGITSQTKLLALNATIEAARAGDAGVGFAVVAKEVNELAAKTERATKEIIRLTRNIQKSSVDTTQAIETVSSIVEEVSVIANSITSAVEKQTKTVSSITVNMREADTAATTIAKSVRDAARGLTEVSSSIKSVDESVASTAENANQVKESALVLSENSMELKKVIDQFKLSPDA